MIFHFQFLNQLECDTFFYFLGRNVCKEIIITMDF